MTAQNVRKTVSYAIEAIFSSLKKDDGSVSGDVLAEMLHVFAAQPAFFMGMAVGYSEEYCNSVYETAKEAMLAGAELKETSGKKDANATIN